jgi:hypothetical protein
MNTTILNRDFQHPADGWYQIEPKGDHPNRSAGIVQIIDEEAICSIVNRFNGDAKEGKLRHGHEMLVDHEHFADMPDQETRAYGWLQELQNRDDGIYGRIRWTTTGKAAVDGGDYRFFSTEYDPKDLKVLNAGQTRRVRPLRLDGLSLTNMNNNRGQKPITNRTNFAGARVPAANQPQHQRTNTMKSIAQKLGLAAEASEDAILAEVTKVINRAETSEKEIPTLKNRVTELETSNGTLLGEQVEALFDAHGIKAENPIRNTVKPVLVGLKNREERVNTLVGLGFKVVDPKADKSAQSRVLNRGTGQETTTAAETAIDPGDERAKAEKIRNRASEKRKGGMQFDQAWAEATSEVNGGK